jgi:hypothetical protein
MLLASTDYFLSTKPAYPWSEYPFGLPALALVAAALVGLTLWTYLNHPAATRKRVFIVLALRLAALVVALLTALRPSVGVQEDPKIPSVLVIGIDMSESMTIKDGFNNQTRLAAVRKILEKCEPILDELRTEQNVNVVLYGFGNTDFNEAANKYDATAPAAFKRSDYGIYLSRTLDRWQTERFVRAHLIVGDGIDNGTSLSAIAEAGRWRNTCPIHTFAVGTNTVSPDAKDVAIAAVAADPSPVPVKNDVTIKVLVNAFGFVGARVPVKVSFDGEQVAKEWFVLTKTTGNELPITVKAPDKPGEVKVRVEIPIESVPGDMSPANNVVETYLTVTKEGVRVLLVDRLRPENAMLRRVLRAERRFDLAEVIRQGDDPASPGERELFDFDSRAYDVIILGNLSAAQLRAIDPDLPRKLRDQVIDKGTGLLMTGGDATFGGGATRPLDSGWRGSPLEDVIPVWLDRNSGDVESWYIGENNRFQTVPTAEGIRFLMRVGPTEEASRQLWDRLNEARPFCRLTAISRFGLPKPGATVFAVASNDVGKVQPAGVLLPNQVKAPYLLVGRQFGGGSKGRVLAFAGYDTYLWKPFGMRDRPPTREGNEIHAQFWRRQVLWLAHQEEEEGAAYARPEFRRMPVNGKQTIKVGLKQPGGAEAIEPKFDVRIVAPGQKPEEATDRPKFPDAAGGVSVKYDPPVPGEYTVLVKAKGKDTAGKEVSGEATARFLAYPDVSDEMLRTASERDHLEKLAAAAGGKAYSLEDLPGVLKEIKGQPLEAVKPKPKFVPDWRRDHSKGFLPGWLLIFVALIGTEWGLRRLWGMA